MKIIVYVDRDDKRVKDACEELSTLMPKLNCQYTIIEISNESLKQRFGSTFSVARTNIVENEIYLWISRITSILYLRYVLAHETCHIIQKQINGTIHFRQWSWLMDYEHHRNCIVLLYNTLLKRAGLKKAIHVSGNEPSFAPTINAHANIFMDVDVNNFLVKTGVVPIDDFISTIHSFTEDIRGLKQDFMEGSLDRMWEKFNSGTLDRKEKISSQAGVLFAEFLVNLGVRWAKLSPLFGHTDFNKISRKLINAQIDSMTDKHGSFVSWPQLEEYWQKLRDCDFDNLRVEKLLKYIAEQSVVRVRELKG